MSKILSRNINAGSVGIVADGGSTTTYGTLPTTSDNVAWLRVAEVGLQEAVTSVVVDDLSGSGSGVEGARYVTAREVAGSMRLAITHEGIGAVLAWTLGGTTSSTGAGPYTHTYPTGINTPFRSLVHVYTAADGTSLQSEFAGLQVESLSLSIEAGGIAYATINARGFVASRSSTYQLGVAATQTPAADAYGTSIPVLGRTGSVLSYGGNSVACRSLTLSLTRPLDRAVDFGGDYPAEGVLSGPISVTLEVTRAADEDDTATIRAALMAGSAADLSISFTSGTKVVYIELSDAVVTAYGAPFSSGGALVETVTFTAQALTTGDYGFRFRITNAAAAAVTTNGTWA
jgi:hypothetical protein